MEMKYVLTNEKKIVDNTTLFRIMADRDIPEIHIKKGELGGFVESTYNLDQEGSCWLFDDSCAYEKGRLRGDALAYNHSRIYGKAIVSEKARLRDFVKIYGKAQVYSRAEIMDMSEVFDNARVGGSSSIRKLSKIYERASVHGYPTVTDNAEIFGKACIENGHPYIRSMSKIYGNVRITEDLHFCISADIKSNGDYFVLQNTGPNLKNTLTAYRGYIGDRKEIFIAKGYSFCGNVDEFEKEINIRYIGKYRKAYTALLDFIKINFEK